MREFGAPEIAHLQARAGVRPRLLVWIEARSRTTGEIAPAGFWNGDQDAGFTIGSTTREYFGAGALLGMDDPVYEVGLAVRRLGIWLSTSAPEVVDAVSAYDVRLAGVEVHRVFTDPLSHQVIAPPRRVWKGWVDGAPRTVPATGLNPGRITISVASAALALTRGSPAKYSDAQWQALHGGDRIFRYADVSGKVPIYWGEEKYTSAARNRSGGVVSAVTAAARTWK